MTPWEFLNYYATLLLMQYKNKPKAVGMIQALVNMVIQPQVSTQTITFSAVAASGSFTLQYGLVQTTSLAWNASASTIQSALQAISGLSAVTVAGSIASQTLTITFTGVSPPALILILAQSLIYDSSGNAVTISIAETDVTLPQAIQNAYQIGTAVGVQLDVLGEYCGVSRQGYSFSGPMTLDDAQFTTLIQLAILQNNNGSSLLNIQNEILLYFPGVVSVFDHYDMRMSYFFDVSIGTDTFAEFVIKAGLLPKPMGVQLAVLTYVPISTQFFGFRTYKVPPYNVVGFNNYQNTYPGSWLSYQNGIYE